MHVLARTDTDTQDFGARLARSQPPGEALAVVFLQGGLGAGKTTLVRGFLRARGFEAAVRSPTYALVELYPLGAHTLVHADLYRLHDPSELESLGLRDWAQSGYTWLIEWPERAGGRLPAADLTLSLCVTAGAHDIEVAAHSPLGRAWLRELNGTSSRRQVEAPGRAP